MVRPKMVAELTPYRTGFGPLSRPWLPTRASLFLAVSLLCLSGCADATVESDGLRAARSEQMEPALQASATVATSAPIAGPAGPAPRPDPTALTIPPTPTPLPIEHRTLLFSGDVLSHTPVISQARAYGVESGWAYDYRPMFSSVGGRVSSADLAVCVLETPVSPDNIGLDGYPTFNAPRELPDALVAVGYDGCSTASNHSLDRGPGGVRTTLAEMDRVGLAHAGMARGENEALQPRQYDLDGVVVAHLSYTYGLNGFRLPADEPWLVNLNDPQAILAEAQRAKESGADLVVLSIQWGAEYQREPTSEQEALANRLTRSGSIDLIVGNHVHVVQPVAEINGVPVIYGLGNSLSNQSDNCCRTGTQDGVMIEATVRGSSEVGYSVTGLAFAPTWVDRTNFVIMDLLVELDNAGLPEGQRAVYQASFDRTVAAIGSLGVEIPLAG